MAAMDIEAALVSREEAARGTMAFRFQRNGLPFKAGQSADFTLEADGGPVTRTFAIASSPENRETVLIAYRMRPSGFKDALLAMPLGATVRVKPADGDFLLPADPKVPVVLLAGGIGITPMRSMLKHLLDTGQRRDVTLFYSNPTRAEATFLDELESWRERIGLRLVATVTREDPPGWHHETGRIDAAMLRRHLDARALREGVFCVAGPPAMVDAMAKAAAGMGVPPERIKADEFTGY